MWLVRDQRFFLFETKAGLSTFSVKKKGSDDQKRSKKQIQKKTVCNPNPFPEFFILF